jgi:hypothetical protein
MLRGWKRLVFVDPASERHVDVFIEKLEMCHDIDFSDRLEIDYPTISLVDLLLEKMQIVQINEKDIIDTIMLFAEHNVGDGDKETINTTYLSGLCSKDWGLWKTVTTNLEKTKRFVYKYDAVETSLKDDVASKIDRTLDLIEKEPKSLGWKARARVGEKKKWYRDVGDAA